MQFKPELGVQTDSFGVFLANGQRCYEMWVVENPLHKVPTHTTLLSPWFNRQTNDVQYVRPVVREGVAHQFFSEFDYPPGTSAQFIAHAVVTHPVLVEESFFETSYGCRVTRQRFA